MQFLRSLSFCCLAAFGLATPLFAQDIPTDPDPRHWGVQISVSPWRAGEKFRGLMDARDLDISGRSVRIGITRGRMRGSEWGVTFVRRSITEGGRLVDYVGRSYNFGDSVRLAQIVGNLLHNAAKFTPVGGQVTLDATLDGNTLVLRISDNGIGVPVARAGKIFELFAQAQHVPDRVQDGLGIGLSLVRSLVELHGGSIKAHSAGAGHGARMTVTLPAATVAPGLPAHHEAHEQQSV